MVSVPSARVSSTIPKELRETAEPLVEPPGMLTVTAVPGAVKSAAAAVASSSVPNVKVTSTAEVISEVAAVEAKDAVTWAAAAPGTSDADVPKESSITESSSVMVRGTSDTG